MEELPDFLIIGPPRTGTTWLYHCLKFHQQIYLPEIKQLHFFDQNYGKGLDWYKKYFKKSDRLVSGEVTPDYFGDEPAAEKIYRILPEVKLIIIYRNAAERAYSHFKIRSTIGKNKGQSFSQVFKGDRYLRRNSLYGKNLTEYLKYFSRDQFLIIDFESMVCYPAEAFLKICEFLNVSRTLIIPEKVLKTKYAMSRGKSRFPLLDKAKHFIRKLLKGSVLGNKIRRIINSSKVYKEINQKTKIDAETGLQQKVKLAMENIIKDDRDLFFKMIDEQEIDFWKT